MPKTRKFKIEFTKQGNMWESGFLIQSFHDGKAWVWLKNCDKVTIRKGSVNQSFIAKLGTGESLTCAGYTIRILCENEVPQASSPVVDQKVSFSSSVQVPVDTSSREIPADTSVPPAQVQQAFLDPVLLRSMRSYQIEAASFLLNRLVDGPHNVRAAASVCDSRNSLPLTGAILADDMGTGKTLVGLAVIWALCRHGQGKNWRKEITKWLPKTARSTIYITGGQGGGKANDLDVHSFVSSHASVHPLLVISYDMFRIYAEAFNTVLTLRTLVCDEGHRLKNSVGTKTSLALGNCIAMQRLVLTGTPIQNNLDELYAVVNFTVPGYLGSLDEFQRKFAKIIAAGNDPEASIQAVSKAEVARDALSQKLQVILIRRTGDTLLRELLPRRREYIVAVSMQGSQKAQYLEVAHSLIREGTLDTPSGDRNLSDISIDKGTSKKRKSRSKEEAAEEEEEEEEEEESSPRRRPSAPPPPAVVLPGLQRLRVLCSSGDPGSGVTGAPPERPGDTQSGASKRPRVQDDEGQHPATAVSGKNIADTMSNSSKLLILYSILLYMKSNKQLRRDKIVVASNFIATLNTIEHIVKATGHQFLRIDGSVASDKRQNIVDLFNNENSAFSVCLISVKAGGVGLNLIGANRLILFEPDYNPATDQQAIGRVWRVGQRKEVFIYRLVCAASIEESIIGRQQHKNMLSTVITERKGRKDITKEHEQRKTCPSAGADTLSVDHSRAYDFSCQAPGVLLELILPSSSYGVDMHRREVTLTSDTSANSNKEDHCAADAGSSAASCTSQSAGCVTSHEKQNSLVRKGQVRAPAVPEQYDDIVLNKLMSDTLITCDIKVKMM